METVSIEVITPAIAANWLKQNNKNRPLSETLVNKYSSAMRRGEWILTGESICFSEEGVLTNGQHRLSAVVKSGVSIKTVVVRSVKAEAFNVTDTGKSRCAADVLALNGYPNYIRLSAGARTYMQHKLKLTTYEVHAITGKQLVDIIEKTPRLHHWTKICANKGHRFIPSRFIGIATYAEELYGTEKISYFAERLISGAGLYENDPILMLRNKLTDRIKGNNISQSYTDAYIIKSINAFICNKKLGLLRYRPDKEDMPELIKP